MTITLSPPKAERTDRPAVPRRTVNQTLCAATHVAEGFASYVVQILDGLPGGGAPSITEDPVALLRHAVAAERLRCARDAVCAVITVAVLAAVVGRLAGPIGYGPAGATAAALIGVWLCGRPLRRGLRALCVWAWRNKRDRHRPSAFRWITGSVLVAVLVAVLALRAPVVWQCTGVIVAGLAMGWIVVVAESVVAHRRAAAIVAAGLPGPRGLARPVGERREARAESLITANVIAYGEPRAAAPFVGNGFIVRPWKMDIDTRRRAVSDESDTETVEPFDVVDFHRWLESQFLAETAVESTASRRLTAGHRLYVDGRKIGWDSPLVVDGRPVTRVDWDYLTDELRHPEQADDQRVYFYLQEVCRDGEIGVCTLVRPVLQSGSLSIEFVPLVIPPVHPDVEALVAERPVRMRDHFGRAVRVWTPHLPSTVFGAPARCLLRALRRAATLSMRTRWRLATTCGWFYDLGALMSVREGVCWREPKEFDHFIISDLIRINDQLRDRLVKSIEAYLSAHGIDIDQLRTAVSVTQIQHWNVGNVRADMVGFGNNNTFGNPGRDADGKSEGKKEG